MKAKEYEAIDQIGKEALRRVIRDQKPEGWKLDAYLNQVERQLTRKYKDKNWARRVRDEVEKSAPFQTALKLVKL